MKNMIIVLVVFGVLQVMMSYEKRSERKKIFIPPSKSIVHFTFGYNDFLSSLMWVRLMQDFEVCDQNKERTKYPNFTAGMDRLSETLERDLPESTCDKGWVYQMLDVITDLTPDFKAAYLDGGTMLSVMVDDRHGATEILNKGIHFFPDDWQLLYRTAYHELFEMQNAKKAEVLLRKAGDRGAPEWVYSLSAKILTRLGRAAFAKSVLEAVLSRDRAGTFQDRLKSQLEQVNSAIKEEIQKGAQ